MVSIVQSLMKSPFSSILTGSHCKIYSTNPFRTLSGDAPTETLSNFTLCPFNFKPTPIGGHPLRPGARMALHGRAPGRSRARPGRLHRPLQPRLVLRPPRGRGRGRPRSRRSGGHRNPGFPDSRILARTRDPEIPRIRQISHLSPLTSHLRSGPGRFGARLPRDARGRADRDRRLASSRKLHDPRPSTNRA